MSGRIELLHAELLTARLLSIPLKIRQTVEQKALTEANRLAAGKLKENAPSETGALKRSIRTDIRKYKGGEVIAGLAGADYKYVGTVQRNKRGKKTFKRNNNATGNVRRPAKYFHILELGTKERTTKAGKTYKGPAMKFREKTIGQIASRVQQLFENAVHEALR